MERVMLEGFIKSFDVYYHIYPLCIQLLVQRMIEIFRYFSILEIDFLIDESVFGDFIALT